MSTLHIPAVPTDLNDLSKWITIGDIRYRVVSYESEVGVSIEQAWAELAGNYCDVSQIQRPVINSYRVEGAPSSGLGADRHCDINFQGRTISIRERIVQWIDQPEHKEYTYDVYWSKGFPAKVMNTWRLQQRGGKTYLANIAYFRMTPMLLSELMVSQMRGVVSNSVLGFRYFLETKQRKASPSIIKAHYAL